MNKDYIFNIATHAATFVTGAAVGSFVAGYFVKKKMEALNEKDISDMREAFKNDKLNSYFPNPASDGSEVEIHTNQPIVTIEETDDGGAIFTTKFNGNTVAEVDSIRQGGDLDSHKVAYSSYSSSDIDQTNPNNGSDDAKSRPYWIDETDFTNDGLYESETYFLYVDKMNSEPGNTRYVVCDENDVPVDNADTIIGNYEPYVTEYADSIYMRNDALRTDYEIIPTNIPFGPNGPERQIPISEDSE